MTTDDRLKPHYELYAQIETLRGKLLELGALRDDYRDKWEMTHAANVTLTAERDELKAKLAAVQNTSTSEQVVGTSQDSPAAADDCEREEDELSRAFCTAREKGLRRGPRLVPEPAQPEAQQSGTDWYVALADGVWKVFRRYSGPRGGTALFISRKRAEQYAAFLNGTHPIQQELAAVKKDRDEYYLYYRNERAKRDELAGELAALKAERDELISCETKASLASMFLFDIAVALKKDWAPSEPWGPQLDKIKYVIQSQKPEGK